ncbi:4-(cytidine 5'-diphospho)-2-C-methyl-D-erythritol kinase [Methylocella silvestris BL2]|uniref:4-diphosphocytidyl-2-C-methyl-D-erythritol kinase n=1 Tax=Methylocella silvestris (strain DSM 15510 / CIP 108128 / LMG 27833 / NCIMB 13906 / BL2) TaxID=395965 RepID=B8ENF6_METSB|nr:4-(cytidine 5'-diphospho)-2-C-methyl-D-erythritol kinase [Methylocella silvestris]ACK50087.1 4-(cytidine 5'-diphospho)-2-C-methyl-D-erythritol kinase [Methylocella silvestris BL2]
MPLPLIERAPAKINLTLHILGRRADGWHELESLVVFSRTGDQLSLIEGEPLSLTIEGPTAPAAGEVADNLVLRAARHFAAAIPDAHLGAFHLVKRLPVAAGIGGGSSDAAAALRLLARANGVPPDDERLIAAARKTGADVPVCLAARGRIMRGFGDELGPVLKLPPLVALIVNPNEPLETRRVFERMDIAPGARTDFGGHPKLASGMGPEELIAALAKGRNDMEPAACRLAPIIGDVLSILGSAPGAKLARMSGSGATCFALFKDCKSAARARKAILRAHPRWWVKSCVLN